MSEKKKSENELEVIKADDIGNVKIADDVVAIISGLAASEVKGVAGMSGGIAGDIVEILRGKNLAKGVKVVLGEEDTTIDLFIIVEYGIRIPDIAWEIQNRVKKDVESMTGLNVKEVNINVQAVNIEKESKKVIKEEE